MVTFLEGVLGRNFDYRMALAKSRHSPEPPVCSRKDYKLIFEIIDFACSQTNDPELIKRHLKSGLDAAQMSADRLSKIAFSFGGEFDWLGNAYRNYRE